MSSLFWDHRKDDNLLVFCYENMKADLEETIEKVAQFIGIPLDDELKQIVPKTIGYKVYAGTQGSI